MRYSIENEQIQITVDNHGAELVSLIKKETGKEYMWCADPEYWGRVSPVLFPTVGKVAMGRLLIGEDEYPMGQHGFARDMDFELVGKEQEKISFVLNSNEETRKLYPYDFSLTISYELKDKDVLVSWKVDNKGADAMHFQIGAHPAFNCPLGEGATTDCSLRFDKKDGLMYGLLNDDGLLEYDSNYITLDNGVLPIDEHLFDNDALIIENNQTHGVALCGPDGKSYVTVLFEAPLVGIWSPKKKNAPFVCIEPWYGRSDRFDFTGSIEEREYINTLSAGESFNASYTIKIA